MAPIYTNKEILKKAKACSSYEEFFKYLEKSEIEFDLHILDEPMQPNPVYKKYISKNQINYLFHLNDIVYVDGGIWGTIEGTVTNKRITKEHDSLGDPIYYPEYYVEYNLWYLNNHWYKEEEIKLTKK